MLDPHVEALFNRLRTEADLDRLIREQRQEDIHLEFKKVARSHARIEDSDRKKFSQTLSGFANADGGVFVFGIGTTKVKGTDVAASLLRITDCGDFLSRLADSILNSTQPPVDGVRLEFIPAVGAVGAGYVKGLVPPSDRPPHRAVLADHQQYFRRTTSGHRTLDHYELEDAFGRRLRPVLYVGVKLLVYGNPVNTFVQELRLSLLNVSRGLAHHVGFVCFVEGGPTIRGASEGLTSAVALNDGRPVLQYYEPVGVVHPNGIWAHAGKASIGRPDGDRDNPLRITLKWYAENMAPREKSLDVPSGGEVVIAE